MTLQEAIDLINEVHGFDDTSTAVGEAWLRIRAELDDLDEADRVLQALQAAGVDNWEGYDYAMELLHED